MQHECIPQAILGQDVICQAKSGMGKTAVFVLSTLQQITPVDGEVAVLVVCHARELADQIAKEFKRFSKYLGSTVKTQVFFGGLPIEQDKKTLATVQPVCFPSRGAPILKSTSTSLWAHLAACWRSSSPATSSWAS